MKFWKPEPKEPIQDFGMWSLLAPIVISALGFFVVGVFAFSFDAIEIIPQVWRDGFTIVGSAMVVFGAELNTPGTFVAVFKKWQKDKSANVFDWSAVVLSGIGTCANLLVVFAIAIMSSDKFANNVPWLGWVLDWGPMIAAFAVACDYYGSLIELGFLFGAFELRKEKWLEEKQTFELEIETQSQPQNDTVFSELNNQMLGLRAIVESLPKPDARKRDFFEWWENLNGKAETIESAAQALVEFEKDTGRRSNTSSVGNWMGEARKWQTELETK